MSCFFFFFVSLNHIRVVQKNILKMLCAPLCKSRMKMIKEILLCFMDSSLVRLLFRLYPSRGRGRAAREFRGQLISHISPFLSTGVGRAV